MGQWSLSGGSIGEHVLRGPARKGTTPPQRARRDAPERATCTPSNGNNCNSPPLTLLPLHVCAPGVDAGATYAAPLLSRPNPPTPTPGESASGSLRCRHPSPPPHPCPSSVHLRMRKVCHGDVWGPRSGGSPPGQWAFSGGIHRRACFSWACPERNHDSAEERGGMAPHDTIKNTSKHNNPSLANLWPLSD